VTNPTWTLALVGPAVGVELAAKLVRRYE